MKQDKGAQPVFSLEKRVKDLNLKRPLSSLRRALYRNGWSGVCVGGAVKVNDKEGDSMGFMKPRNE